MHKQVNHIKLDEAIKASIGSFKVNADRVSFEQVRSFIQKNPSRQSFKQFAFSLNSFVGTLSLTSFINKESLFIFIKKWAVTMYVVAGSITIGSGGYFIYNSFSKNNSIKAEIKNKESFSLINSVIISAQEMIKKMQAASVVIPQTTAMEQTVITNQNANITLAKNNFVQSVPVNNTFITESTDQPAKQTGTNTNIIAENTEPIQLKTADEAEKNQAYDFSNTGTNTNPVSEAESTKDQLTNSETAPVIKAEPVLSVQDKANKNARDLQAKDDKVKSKKRTKNRTIFSLKRKK